MNNNNNKYNHKLTSGHVAARSFCITAIEPFIFGVRDFMYECRFFFVYVFCVNLYVWLSGKWCARPHVRRVVFVFVFWGDGEDEQNRRTYKTWCLLNVFRVYNKYVKVNVSTGVKNSEQRSSDCSKTDRDASILSYYRYLFDRQSEPQQPSEIGPLHCWHRTRITHSHMTPMTIARNTCHFSKRDYLA